MRKTILFFLLPTAAMMIASCATTKAPRAPLAELYDSVAIPQSARLSADDHRALPEPSVAALLEAPAPIAKSGTAAAAAAPRLMLPESPGLIPLSGPKKVVKFQLAAPVAPAPSPRKTTPPPTRQAQPPSPKAPTGGGSPAPRPVAAAPGTGAGASAIAPGAPAAAASAPAGGPPAAATGDSYGRLREIYARQDDELQVGLDGVGFLFLGFPDRSTLADGMSFKGKEIRNGKTWFTFQALKLGTYDLDFLRQDNATGRSDKETVRVHVLTEQDFSAAVNQQPGAGGTDAGAVETGDAAFAGRLTGVGAYASAVAELQKGYREGNPELNDKIASLYMRMGSYDAARKYYSKNVTPPNDYTRNAVLGLVSIALAQKDQKALMESLKRFLAIRDPAVEDPLIGVIRMEANRGEIGLGLDLAGEYVSRYPTGRWRDEADFLTANLLEMDSQFRDIARARELYRRLLGTNPESQFAAAARERLSYIERHFFQVR